MENVDLRDLDPFVFFLFFSSFEQSADDYPILKVQLLSKPGNERLETACLCRLFYSGTRGFISSLDS